MSSNEQLSDRLKQAILAEKIKQKARKHVREEEKSKAPELIVQKASELAKTVRKPERIFGSRFERGSFNLLVGPGEVGKGMVSMDIAARMSTGESFPGENGHWRDPIKLLMCIVEDADAEIIGRLQAAKANLDNIDFLTGPMITRGGLVMPSPMRLDSDAGPIVKLARDGDYGALFVETLVEHFGDREAEKRISTNSESEVRAALAPFRAICREANMFGWALIHPRKSVSGEVSDLISGSAAFYNVPRRTMYVFKDPSDENKSPKRLLCSGKANNLRMRPVTLRFAIEPGDPDESYGRVVWGIQDKTLEDPRDADDVLREIQEKGKIRKDLSVQNAEKFLRALLASGMKKLEDIRTAAEDAGHSWRTVERAKKNLGVESVKDGFPAVVVGWQFPKEEM